MFYTYISAYSYNIEENKWYWNEILLKYVSTLIVTFHLGTWSEISIMMLHSKADLDFWPPSQMKFLKTKSTFLRSNQLEVSLHVSRINVTFSFFGSSPNRHLHTFFGSNYNWGKLHQISSHMLNCARKLVVWTLTINKVWNPITR